MLSRRSLLIVIAQLEALAVIAASLSLVENEIRLNRKIRECGNLLHHMDFEQKYVPAIER